jgi:hypothetical protein
MKIAQALKGLVRRAVFASALMVCVVGLRGCGPEKPLPPHRPVNNGTDASYRVPGRMPDGQWKMADGKAPTGVGRGV